MKIALATVNGKVSQHFGHCDGFTVYQIDNDEITGKDFLESPRHEKGVLPKFLNENNVDKIVAGGMGERAQKMFNAYNIDVIVGINGKTDVVIEKYINNTLQSTETICEEHLHLREDYNEKNCDDI